MNRLLLFIVAHFATIGCVWASDPPDIRSLRPDSPEWREVARRMHTAPPPKLPLSQAFTLVRRSHQKMFASYRREVFLSSARLVLVSDPQSGQPASTPFWEIKYSWNYHPDYEAEIYFVTMDGKLTSLVVRR